MSKIKDLAKWLRTKVVQGFAYCTFSVYSRAAIAPDAVRKAFDAPVSLPRDPEYQEMLADFVASEAVSVDFTTNTTGEKMPNPEKVVVYQLDEDMIKGLEKLLPQPIVTGQATEATLAAQVAYAHVLRILRDGITVKR